MSEQTQAERISVIKDNLERMLPGNTFTVHLTVDETGEHIDVEWQGKATKKQVAKLLNYMSATGKWTFTDL